MILDEIKILHTAVFG